MFLSHLQSLGLKDAVLCVNLSGDEGEDEKNEETCAKLLQFLDDKSLSAASLIIMREAADNGRKARNILRGHYTEKGKSRAISLYIQLTSLKKDINESVTNQP